MKTPTLNFKYSDGETKLKELMLYVADKCSQDPNFGSTKLNKILWWSDFFAFGKIGKPITGVEYQKLDNGPAPRRLLPIRKGMVKKGDACIKEEWGGKHIRHRLISMRKPKINIFYGRGN